MSDLLDNMRETFDARLSAHERMLTHLSLAPTEEEAPLVFHELRATLLACGSCKCPGYCVDWQKQGQEGPPPWCHNRNSFLELETACNALKTQQPRIQSAT
ncbi:DUF6455 family protein [Marivita sp. S0852]|uniref:DUF6455 family protein n=1 Tax=Marivita sp. S0852 TaxID=3373893 RepID=UPI003982943B